MQKLIQRQTIFVIFLFLLEICAAGTLFFLIDIESIEKFIKDILIGSLFVIILLNLIVILVIINKVSNAKMKTDISSLAVMGEDVQEAYDFGKIGLILTDENDEVIWTNKMFDRIQFKLMDHSIFSWEESLKELVEEKIREKKIQINSRFYLVKYLKEARLYIFKDITENEDLHQAAFDQAPVIGLISIDNYQDMANILDETSMTDSLASIQKLLGDYAKTYNLMLKKIKTDSYFFVCEHYNYEKLLNDKFSILKQVRDSSKENQLTISLGIALGVKEYSRLYEFASAALDVALSRGGNQCVVSNYGENLKFFGGQTEAKVAKNAVKYRVNANSLITNIEESSAVYIMGHANADLDAIGACLGVYAFALSTKVKAKIIYDDNSIERQTKNAFKQMFTKEQIAEMTITSSKALDEFTSNSLLIIVDVNNPDMVMSSALLKRAEKIVNIDHHRPGKKLSDPETIILSYVDSSASSTCELIAEMIKYGTKAIDLSPMFATFMLAGIILDTNYYRTHMGAKTYDASFVLKTFGADNGLADSFFKEEYEQHALRAKIVANSTVPYTGVVIAHADQKDIVDRAILAKVGNDLLGVTGVNICFIIGRVSEKEIYISSRSDGTISSQLICEKLNGGGHYVSAATSLLLTSIEEAKNRLDEVLAQYLDDARAKKGDE